LEAKQNNQEGQEEELNLFSLLQSLSIAHFNEGVEWEHLRSYGQALASYELSRDYALKVVENQASPATATTDLNGVKAAESAMYHNATKSIMDLQVKVL